MDSVSIGLPSTLVIVGLLETCADSVSTLIIAPCWILCLFWFKTQQIVLFSRLFIWLLISDAFILLFEVLIVNCCTAFDKCDDNNNT